MIGNKPYEIYQQSCFAANGKNKKEIKDASEYEYRGYKLLESDKENNVHLIFLNSEKQSSEYWRIEKYEYELWKELKVQADDSFSGLSTPTLCHGFIYFLTFQDNTYRILKLSLEGENLVNYIMTYADFHGLLHNLEAMFERYELTDSE